MILNFCITARLKPDRLFNGRGFVRSAKFGFVGVMLDKGGRDGVFE